MIISIRTDRVLSNLTNFPTRFAMALAIMAIAFSSCEKEGDKTTLVGCNEHVVTACSQEQGKTNLRFRNISTYDFCNVVINPSSGYTNIGTIMKGETTCYRAFETAYHYGYIHLSINGKEFSMIPTDYVGETPLGAGNFTYLVDIPNINEANVSVTVIAD